MIVQEKENLSLIEKYLALKTSILFGCIMKEKSLMKIQNKDKKIIYNIYNEKIFSL
jgi:hypothetical protein